MGKQGFRDISLDPFVYLESVSGESVALGIDDTDDNFKISVLATAGANPSGIAILDIDIATNNTILSAGTLDIDATGALQINSSGGAISMGNDAVSQSINIGTGAAARTITIGNATGATSVVVDIGTGALNLGTTATAHTSTLGSVTGASSTVIQSGTGLLNVTSTNGALTINSGTGALGISTDAANTAVNIATGAGVKTLTLGSTNTTSSTTLQAGSGGFAFTSGNGPITINSGTGTIGISTDAANTTVNIATGAGVKTATFGSTNTTSTTTVQSGTGALNVTSTNGALTVNSGTGALGISTDATATTLSIGTGAAAKTVTLGSTNTTSATTINSGTGALGIGTTIAKTITIGNTTGATAVNINIGTGDFTMTSASGTLISQLDTGEMTRPLQPAFLASVITDDVDVTGNAAIYTIGTNVAYTEIFDLGGDFNTNGTFTAPISGRYFFSGTVRMAGVTALMTEGQFRITTSNRVYLSNINPGVSAVPGTLRYSFHICSYADMDAADTAILSIQILGGAANSADIDASAAGTEVNIFSGMLAC